MAIKAPPSWQVKRILRQDCSLIKKTVTIDEDEYGQAEESYSSLISIKADVQPITSEDLRFLPPGVLNEGDARAFLQQSITLTIANVPYYLWGFPYTFPFEFDEDYEFDHSKIEVPRAASFARLIGPPYSTDNPTIRSPTHVFTNPIVNFKETALKPDGTDLKYIVSIDNGATYLWWNGIWTPSNGTYAQSNRASEVDAKISQLGVRSGQFCFKAFLHSDDGTKTPVLDNISIEFGFRIEPDDIIIDSLGTRYEVERVTEYQSNKNIILLELYLKRIRGE